MDQQRWRVQAPKCRRSCPAVGASQKQTQHELRQAVQGAPVLLRQEHHQESARAEVRLPIRVLSRDRKDGEQNSFPRQDGDHQ